MPSEVWKETHLYKALAGREGGSADAVRTLLKNPRVMRDIVQVLDLGGTTPKDFTLHNSDHSFRVAERMWELIPENTRKSLSDFELGLLLLSSFLHDIGMSPEFEKVRRHHSFLTGRKEGLSEAEIDEFQKWIDDDTRVANMDIRTDVVNDEQLINYILSYYVRHKHNDWSGDWIKQHLSREELEHYDDWVDDLILVCKSHHQGLDDLLGAKFDPRFVRDGAVVHRRYLAMCLRVADVMENDPDRTPAVILSHREIDPASLNYWLKDRQFHLFVVDNTYIVSSRPDRAYLHKAIEDTAGQIETELRNCDELVRRKPLWHTSVMPLKGYEWTVNPVVKRDIEPKNGTYVYIQGAFRPNTAKVLDLLGGHQLYRNAIWAFRELLQNAFDAVKEQIAWELINKNLDPAEHLEQLGRMTSIAISLVREKDGLWLICRDQGVGMTKEIIEHYFLQSGVSKRHEIKELERECRRKGFFLGRTGQFGIGVLSYFMLAEKIVITTRREPGTGYPATESVGWRFEVSGTHDFGELTRVESPAGGTQIRLKLNAAVERDIESWDKKFYAFIKDEVVVNPCVLHYKGLNTGETTAGPGWTNSEADIREKVLRVLDFDLYGRRGVNLNSPPEVVSSSTRNSRMADQKRRAEVVEDVKQRLAFLSVEGKIGEQVRYRLHIPYFQLSQGNSFYYLKEQAMDDRLLIQKVGEGYWWTPMPMFPNLGLKGIKIDMQRLSNELSFYRYMYIEVDLLHIEESDLGVSRKELQLDESYAKRLGQELVEKITELFERHFLPFDNAYGLLNIRRNNDFPDHFYWPVAERSGKKVQDLVWEKIQYPAVINYDKVIEGAEKLRLYGLPVRCLSFIKGYETGSFEDEIPAFARGHEFGFRFVLGLFRAHPYVPYAVILGNPYQNELAGYNIIELPVQWKKVLMITSGDEESFSALNIGHPIYEYFDAGLIHLYASGHHANDLVRGRKFPQLASEVDCATFLVFAAQYISRDKWIAHSEENPELFANIFARLKLKEFYLLDHEGLSVVGPNRYDLYEKQTEIGKRLPIIEEGGYYFSAKNV